jgi:hypothetical protein
MKSRTLVFLAFILLWALASSLQAQSDPPQVRIEWGKVIRESKTTATFQIVMNPLLRPGSRFHDSTFRAIKELGCDRARFATWYPYPKLAVAELEPPRDGKTSWDFSEMGPIVGDFLEVTKGHGHVLSLNTSPQWMFETPRHVPYPHNPDQAVYSYLQGTALRDPSMKEVSSYYKNLASWFSLGGFTDQFGRRFESSHQNKIDYWEVLNEPDIEHQFTPEKYTALYDAVVGELKLVLPGTKFVGISLSTPMVRPDYFEYFLNPQNHKPGIPLDAISYHFYAIPGEDETLNEWQFTLFEQAERFLTTVRYIQSIRQRLSPSTETHINEIGSVLPEDMIQMSKLDHRGPAIPESYGPLSAALFAYLFGELSKMGVEVAGMSHMLGYPGFFPNCTMLDWNTGEPNVRYWALKLLRDNFGPGDKLVETAITVPNVYGQAWLGKDGKRRLLLVNRRNRDVEITLPEAKGVQIQTVGRASGSRPPVAGVLNRDKLNLEGFAISVVTFPQP